MITVDARCTIPSCSRRTGIYRMVGSCRNCRQSDILILISESHEAPSVDCPVCGCNGTVNPQRLATPDEIPAPKRKASSD